MLNDSETEYNRRCMLRGLPIGNFAIAVAFPDQCAHGSVHPPTCKRRSFEEKMHYIISSGSSCKRNSF